MFDCELDYYGIMSFEGIMDQDSLPPIMAEAKWNFHVAKVEHNLVFLAHGCHYKLYQKMIDNNKMHKGRPNNQ